MRIEVSNGRHGEVAEALAIWDKLLARAAASPALARATGIRAPNPIDVANVRVFAPVADRGAILAAIRAGHVIVMNDAQRMPRRRSWCAPATDRARRRFAEPSRQSAPMRS